MAFILPPAALLVVDVQNGVFHTSPPPLEGDEIISRINRLASQARAARVPVIFVQHDGHREDNLIPLLEGWQLDDRLKIEPTDLRIRKQTCDAFYETELEKLLRERGVKSVVITGYATEFCIDATVRNAVSKNFRTYVVSDAHTTNDSPVLKASLIRDHHNWAWPNSAAKSPITMLETSGVNF